MVFSAGASCGWRKGLQNSQKEKRDSVECRPDTQTGSNGMEKESIKNIFPLDRQENGTDHRSLQRSVEKVVEHENHEWQTLRVQEDTKIKVE